MPYIPPEALNGGSSAAPGLSSQPMAGTPAPQAPQQASATAEGMQQFAQQQGQPAPVQQQAPPQAPAPQTPQAPQQPPQGVGGGWVGPPVTPGQEGPVSSQVPLQGQMQLQASPQNPQPGSPDNAPLLPAPKLALAKLASWESRLQKIAAGWGTLAKPLAVGAGSMLAPMLGQRMGGEAWGQRIGDGVGAAINVANPLTGIAFDGADSVFDMATGGGGGMTYNDANNMNKYFKDHNWFDNILHGLANPVKALGWDAWHNVGFDRPELMPGYKKPQGSGRTTAVNSDGSLFDTNTGENLVNGKWQADPMYKGTAMKQNPGVQPTIGPSQTSPQPQVNWNTLGQQSAQAPATPQPPAPTQPAPVKAPPATPMAKPAPSTTASMFNRGPQQAPGLKPQAFAQHGMQGPVPTKSVMPSKPSGGMDISPIPGSVKKSNTIVAKLIKAAYGKDLTK